MTVSKSNFHSDIKAILQGGTPEQAAEIRKAAVGASGSSSFSGDFDSMVAADFYLSEEHSPLSLLRWLVQEGKPARVGVIPFVGSGITAAYIGDGLGIPTSKYVADDKPLSREKCAGIVVCQKEAAQYPENVAAIERELTQAVRLAEDERILSLCSSGTSNIFASIGAPPIYDLQAALSAVNTTAFSRLVIVLHPTYINLLATSLGDNSGLLLFPDASPGPGGSVLGIPVIASTAAGDNLYMLDANCFCVADEGLTLRTSENAPLEMADSTAQDVGEATGMTNIVSAFQVDAIAVLGLRSFGFRLLRSTGCAVVTDLGWSATTTTTSGA